MESKQIEELPAEIKRVLGQLDEWRGQRRHGQRIPEELWGAAVRAVGRHGLNRVSQALGLDYYNLKKRSGLCKEKKEARPESGAVFVELEATRAEAAATCVVELEKGNGAKLRVSVHDAATVDWCRLKEAFLGA